VITIRFDRAKPMASVELTIASAPDYGLAKGEAQQRGQIPPVLSSEGFKDLVEAVRAAFEERLASSRFEILRISGIVCHDVNVYRPGILLMLQERGREGTIPESGRKYVTELAEGVRESFGLD
jgi:hypothetical protein